MGIKGCWTCRARKVRCDLKRPVCDTCSKVRRICQGYGIQLSWPRQGDKRRALVYTTDSTKGVGLSSRRHRKAEWWFLNTLNWDMSLSDALQEGKDPFAFLQLRRVSHLPYLQPSLLTADDTMLFDYFNDPRSQILTPVMDDALAHFVMRAALSSPSSPLNMILEGIFAIAALQLGKHSESLVHQSRIISLLRTNIPQTDRESVMQNVIASMLLYQYEILTAPTAFFLCGARRTLHASASMFETHQYDSAILINWVYYHEVISGFSLRYWAEAGSMYNFCKVYLARPYELVNDVSVIPNGATCPIDVLDMIRRICELPTTFNDDENHDQLHDIKMEKLRELTIVIQKAVGETGSFHETSETSLTRQEMLAYLYRCAALIYYNRAVLEVPAFSFQHRRLVREGLFLLQHLDCCESAWPLLIIACEANEDDLRLQVLEILLRMGRDPVRRSNHIPLVQSMVQAVWNQNDLNIDGEVSYIRTLNAVVSTLTSLPLLA